MKLKVYQQGGGLIYTPFIPEQTAVTSSASKSSSSNDEDSKIDPIDKELLALMKNQELLPSDIDTIYKQLVLFQRRSQNLSSAGFGGTDTYSSVMPGILQITSLASKAKYEKSKANDVENRLRSENAWADPALDSNGRMYVKDIENDQLTLINTSDFDREKYIPISNSQLLSYRELSAGFNTNLLNDLQQAVGMTSISKEIDRIIKSFGTAETENYIDKDIAQALELLNESSPEGIYKLSQKRTSADMEKALALIYNQLPTNMQRALNARASISDTTPGELVREILLSNLSYKTGIDYDATATKASATEGSGAGDGSDEKNLKERTYTEQLATGSNYELPKMTTFNPVSTVSLHAAIQNTGGMKKDDGKTPIGAGMVDAIMEEAGWFKEISGQYSVTFGDQIIDQTAQGALMYDGSSVQRIKLPYKEENGELTVNWKLVEELENINKQISGNGATPGMIEELLSNHPDLYYNKETQTVEAINSMWFLTFGAMMGTDFVDGLDTNSRYLEKVDKDSARFWHKKYEEAAEYGFVNHDKNAPKRTDPVTDKGLFGFDWSATKYYRGNVFVPIRLTLAGAKEYYPAASHMHNMQTQAMSERDAQIQQSIPRRNFNW